LGASKESHTNYWNQQKEGDNCSSARHRITAASKRRADDGRTASAVISFTESLLMRLQCFGNSVHIFFRMREHVAASPTFHSEGAIDPRDARRKHSSKRLSWLLRGQASIQNIHGVATKTKMSILVS
jgi:hypothetical protein